MVCPSLGLGDTSLWYVKLGAWRRRTRGDAEREKKKKTHFTWAERAHVGSPQLSSFRSTRPADYQFGFRSVRRICLCVFGCPVGGLNLSRDLSLGQVSCASFQPRSMDRCGFQRASREIIDYRHAIWSRITVCEFCRSGFVRDCAPSSVSHQRPRFFVLKSRHALVWPSLEFEWPCIKLQTRRDVAFEGTANLWTINTYECVDIEDFIQTNLVSTRARRARR